MALSADFIDGHIDSWQRQLSSPYYPHRKHWPACLFHHSPLQNAVSILTEGLLRSRNDANNSHPLDVAAAGVIDARCDAHDWVRLYFRPKTPTQYHIEGIRRPADCKYPDAHAPVFIMFVLDAKAVLSLPDIQFSNKNMQIGSTIPGNDENYFSQIPFIKVFSEGNNGGDQSIIDARCAEVMTSSPLDLRHFLKAIYFRSEPERDTVLHMIGEHRATWSKYCHVSDALKVFEKQYTFVQEVGLTPEGVVFRFNPRRDRAPLGVRIEVFNHNNDRVLDFNNQSLAAVPDNNMRWIFNSPLADGLYHVKITLDGHLAYCANIPLSSVLF